MLYCAFDLYVVRTFRSAVSGEPKGSHYVVFKNALGAWVLTVLNVHRL